MADMMAEFFINPEIKPDLRILRDLPRPEFLVDVHLNKGISAISVKMAKGEFGLFSVVPVIIAFFILSSFLYFSFFIIRASIKGKENSRMRPGLLLPFWIHTFIGTLFLLLFVLAMKEAMARHLYLLVFGLPESWAFLLSLPWILLVALIVSLFKAKTLLLGTKEILPRVFLSLGWTGSAGLLVWLVFWEVI
jgi:hypothetical protein